MTPEGGRSHEYVIGDLANRYRADGWCTHRPKNRPIPIFLLREDGLWVMRVPGAPVHPAQFLDFHGTADVRVAWPTKFLSRHAAYADALRGFRDPRGGRTIAVWSMSSKGHIRIPMPDLVMHRGSSVVVAEAYSNGSSSIHEKIGAYAEFDEVLIAIFKGGRVFDPERPLEVRLHRRQTFRLRAQDPPISGRDGISR